MQQHHIGPKPTPRRLVTDHAAAHAKHMQGVKMTQLRGRWINLSRAVAAWEVRKDKLRPYEAKMFEDAKSELDKVEAQLDEFQKADAEAGQDACLTVIEHGLPRRRRPRPALVRNCWIDIMCLQAGDGNVNQR